LSARAITIYASGVFLKPVSASFGISRGTLFSTVALLTVVAVLVTPVFGPLIDRLGVRIVLLPMIALFALATSRTASG
jgi:MFS family permease